MDNLLVPTMWSHKGTAMWPNLYKAHMGNAFLTVWTQQGPSGLILAACLASRFLYGCKISGVHKDQLTCDVPYDTPCPCDVSCYCGAILRVARRGIEGGKNVFSWKIIFLSQNKQKKKKQGTKNNNNNKKTLGGIQGREHLIPDYRSAPHHARSQTRH